MLAVFVCAFIFTVLFYRQYWGLNLLIFEAIVFGWMLVSKQFNPRNKNTLTVAIAFVATAAATVITHSYFSYIINICVFFLLIGVVIYPEVKSYATSIRLAFFNIFNSQRRFFSELTGTKQVGSNIGRWLWRARLYIIPLVIIMVFVFIYRLSNPVFNDLLNNIGEFFDRYVFVLFEDIDFWVIFTFALGLVVNNFIWLRTKVEYIITGDASASEELTRKRENRKKAFASNALKSEYNAAIFLLVTLNIIILILNVIDVKWIWFRTVWEKQYLMQFVHEGTYLLIFSIFISIGLVLYYFRQNLNFYSKNALLKKLSYVWLAQNAIMVISVAIRNYRYIEYFALAYKRIGVFIFLALVLYGLYTVFVKVQKRKSAAYLFSANMYAAVVVLVVASLFNWDVMIARYNFAHAGKAAMHLNYMADLSDSALPELDRPVAEISQMKIFEKDEYRGYLSAQEYVDYIAYRKKVFKAEWEAKTWQEWNWAEYNAYHNLK